MTCLAHSKKKENAVASAPYNVSVELIYLGKYVRYSIRVCQRSFAVLDRVFFQVDRVQLFFMRQLILDLLEAGYFVVIRLHSRRQ